MLYIENPKGSIKKLLELTNEFSKIVEYKINIWKSIVFLYNINRPAENKIKKTITFIIALKTIIYLEINLTREVKDLYTKNYQTLMKKIKDTNKKITCIHESK